MHRIIGSPGMRRLLFVIGFGAAGVMSIGPAEAQLCGGVDYAFPYTDVSGVGAAFCPGIMEAVCHRHLQGHHADHVQSERYGHPLRDDHVPATHLRSGA